MSKFDQFNVFSTNYKTVEVGIPVDILIPRGLSPGTYPSIVRFHGGGYVCIVNGLALATTQRLITLTFS